MSEKKKVHRLERKSPVEYKSVSSETGEGTGGVQFQKFEALEVDVEDAWQPNEVESESETVSKARAGLRVVLSVMAVFFVGLVAWAAVLLNAEDNASVVVVAEAEDDADAGRVNLSMNELFELRKAAVIDYFSTEQLEEKIGLVRQAERVGNLMREHYRANPLKSLKEVVVRGETPLRVDGETLWKVEVYVEGERRVVMVESDPSGVARVDWESEVGHQPSNFTEFKKNRSSEFGVFRVFIKGAQLQGFHGFEFADYNQYRCFKISIAGHDDYLWAYTEMGSELDKLWFNIVTQGQRRAFDSSPAQAVTLQLKYPENAMSERCVCLGELVKMGWLP